MYINQIRSPSMKIRFHALRFIYCLWDGTFTGVNYARRVMYEMSRQPKIL